MKLLENTHYALYTDHYELTMAQGYFVNGMHETPAVFDYFFRKLPFKGGYAISAGLGELLDILEGFEFDRESLGFLRKQGFRPDFLDYLEVFRFAADIHAVREGEVVFPNEPVFIVSGSILEAQIVETLILNALNYPTLIATKASRIKKAAQGRQFMDFGMRRAQGAGALQGSRASIIGGAMATSNVLAGKLYDIPLSGTQAHSWIQSFDDEIAAFRKFVRAFPEKAVLLVDTYDTLKSGIPNAITVAREMEERGESLWGVRLDSGDLAYFSKKSRELLDEAGLHDVKIIASNQLDEYIIKSLLEQGANIDAFGVGTRLMTGVPDGSLDGVYKLAWSGGKDRLKISENVEKVTLPGKKGLYRLSDHHGNFVMDAITVANEPLEGKIFHPYLEGKASLISGLEQEQLLHPVMQEGKVLQSFESVAAIAEYATERLSKLPEEHKRFENPHVYRVGISNSLRKKRRDLIENHI